MSNQGLKRFIERLTRKANDQRHKILTKSAEDLGLLAPLPPADGRRPFGNLFLNVGAMKAGTTWLYSVLVHHPELHFSHEKEIHYFYHRYVDAKTLSDERRLANAQNKYLAHIDPATSNVNAVQQRLRWTSSYLQGPIDNLWYRNIFSLRRSEKYNCDFSNLSAHIPAEAWPLIRESCDNLRVVFVMRDPIKRLWSHMRFALQQGQQLGDLKDWSPKDYDLFARQSFIWMNGEYGQVVRRLCDGLPDSNRLILFYEDLHADQRGALRKIETFLGIPHFNYPEAALQAQPTKSEPIPMPDFFARLFSKDVARIKKDLTDLGFAPPESWM